MPFNSLTFCVFFVVVYCVYLTLTRRYRWQNVFLLAASYVFYGWWDWRFLSLIAVSTAVDYFVARSIESVQGGSASRLRKRRLLLLVSIVTNLSILAFFKYFNFFADSATSLLSVLGFAPDRITLEIILPIGISFYTFQSLSYTIDVYRGKLPVTRKLVDFALFVAFFPQLVAGPIERAKNLLPQIQAPRSITAQRIYTGVYLILWGYFEKVVVADNVGRIADEIFANHEKYQGVDIAIGAFAFALQILGDFSGYSNIARGTSRLMGFDLMINFRLPYFATSPADFWRRWHISLSTWLRDYLYIPLGGNRNGSLRTYRNLFATMLLGGLWHGAAWNFLLWGAYHGVGLIAHRAISTLRPPDEVRRGRFANFFVVGLKIVCMFAFTLGGWLLFRSTSIGQSLDMAASFGVGVSDASLAMITGVLFYAWPLVAAQFLQWRKGDLFALINLPAPVVTVLGAAILAMIAVFGARQPMEFIYFQF